MSYNGSGTFLINTSGQPVVTGTPISSTVFNALTADLATGLSTAITKDGQTATTARIPFAQGISSTLVTDSTSTTTGSIITAGGAGVAKALFVGTTANVAGAVTLQSTLGVTGITTFSAQPIFSSLTASSAVATDASKGLVSVTNTGTGNNVLATSPTLVTPVLGAASATSVTVAAGAVGTPSITTAGDTNTGIFFPAADTIAFTEGGVESVRIDASGNVGIGTSSPTEKLTVSGNTSLSGNLTFTGTGNRITGDFTNATIANRPAFQNSTANSATVVGLLPSGTATQSQLVVYNNSDPTNANGTQILVNATESRLQATNNGTASSLPMTFYTGGSERVRVDTSGNVGIGTSSPGAPLSFGSTADAAKIFLRGNTNEYAIGTQSNELRIASYSATTFYRLGYAGTESMRIDSSGSLLVGKTASSFGTAGVEINAGGGNFCRFTRDGGSLADFNRLTNDGELVGFWQATTQEGSISVSGTTVSYNGGHLSRWAQTTTAKDDTLVKGTVLSNLDEMNVYTDADGNPVDNEQLNKVKVSDVEGDANVAGVFVNWTHDDAHDVDEINMAMTGDMIIRIAQGTTVARGDLLMSAGDGTAKPQGDDIVRSKTVAKVTSTHVTCTYADGSYCVPCVLMAC